MERIGSVWLLNQCLAHPGLRGVWGFKTRELRDQPAINPALRIEIERDRRRVSVYEEKNATDPRFSSGRWVKSMDEFCQSASVIIVVMRESNDRNLSNADGVQPVSETITVRSDIDQRGLKLSRTHTR
jgi:hypothetical protein